MFTIQDLIASFTDETRIIKHLATKLPNGTAAYDYKPNAYQRSMKEFMYYIATMGHLMTKIISEGSYTPELAKATREQVLTHDLEMFATMMDEQLAVVVAYLESVTEDKMAEEINPFGMGSVTRKSMIFGMHHKNFTAYRMQFFLYLKDAWAHELKTSNLWMGMDS